MINTDFIHGEWVNLETGEKESGSLLINEEAYEFVNKESKAKRIEYLRGKQKKSEFEELAGRFTWTLSSTIKNINQDERFSQTEKTRIIFLGTFVSYQEKGSYLTHDNGNLIYKNKLQALLEMTNKKEFYKFYNKMLEAGIVREEVINKSTVKIKWSNTYNFRGTAPSSELKAKNLIKTFDKQVRELYQEKDNKGKKVHTPNNLYTLFMLLPYVHPESNMLCLHPEDSTDCQPLTIAEIAKMFGYNRTNDLKRKLFKVKFKDLPVFAVVSNANYTHILVNPFVVYRSNKAPNDALMMHFEDTAKRLLNK
ncbi:hypothetical protein [Oceanobacillus halotolerans]|uniref:hypothetical protein n=1 Tax=Oceanobacillus halotolerans TaxID=2663380 RepID=UPI0013DCA31D|nr:hypothetical protein [Oceanobacillus halotolerans]